MIRIIRMDLRGVKFLRRKKVEKAEEARLVSLKDLMERQTRGDY